MSKVIADDIKVDLNMSYKGWEVTELEAISSRYNETDLVNATVVDPDFSEEPTIGNFASLDIDGRRVFTGNVYNVSEKEKNEKDKTGKFEVKLMNDLHKAKNTEISISVEEQTPISELVQQVCEEANLLCVTDLTWRVNPARDVFITPDFSNMMASEALRKLAERANADWFVDNYNILRFGMPDTEVKQVEYIKSPSKFGPVEPPYKGVKVVPDGAISNRGQQLAYRLVNYIPFVTKRALVYNDETGTWEINYYFTNQPTFVYRDEQIKTFQTAEAVADKFARELLRQVKGGKLVIVGDARIDERDVIELPDAYNNRRYFVGEVKHKINDSDGFTTEIKLEGVVPEDDV